MPDVRRATRRPGARQQVFPPPSFSISRFSLKKSVQREVQLQFESRLARSLPGFRPIAVELPPGYLAYSWRLQAEFTTFVVLCPIHQEERFLVQAGWSERGTFPGEVRQIAGHLFPDPGGRWPAHGPVNGGLLFFLVDPKRRGTQALVWDVLTGRRVEADDLYVSGSIGQASGVAACLDDVMDLLLAFGLPYIESRTGVPIPLGQRA